MGINQYPTRYVSDVDGCSVTPKQSQVRGSGYSSYRGDTLVVGATALTQFNES